MASAAILLAQQNNFSNFGRESPKEHFCEIILKSGHWPRRRCCLKFVFFFCLFFFFCFIYLFLFLALAAILFSGAEPF